MIVNQLPCITEWWMDTSHWASTCVQLAPSWNFSVANKSPNIAMSSACLDTHHADLVSGGYSVADDMQSQVEDLSEE